MSLESDEQTEFKRPNMNPERLAEESYEDYKKRRALVNRAVRQYRKAGRPFHFSTVLIPEMKDGKLVRDENGKPVFTGKKTKGQTYVKPKVFTQESDSD
jgi:hypothetical protein